MRVALFVTCLVDLLRPSVGFAAIKLLEAAGCTVHVPATQTCCGQPAYNAGDRAAAIALAIKTIAECEDADYLVTPSGSCADQIRNAYRELLADDPVWQNRAERLAGRTHELSDFLATVLRVDALPGDFAGSVTHHDSCSGLRGLAIRDQPRALLARLPRLSLREMPGAEECCGFGGTFSLGFGEISSAIAERKCANARLTGADALVGGHAYGWVYPGPMGAILTPLFGGLEKALDLPQASTLCRQCSAVCPVRIPPPGLLRKLRERQAGAGLRPRGERLALRLWAWQALRPTLYALSTRVGVRYLNWLAGGAEHIAALGVAPGWSVGRDLPAPQGKTFPELHPRRQLASSRSRTLSHDKARKR